MEPFLYVFAVNDYPVPEQIRAMARKEKLVPLSLRTRIHESGETVESSLYLTKGFSLASQTGRRSLYEDRPIWDIPFKITYAGSKTERRASFITPKPTTNHVTVAALQEGPVAIVLYEADLKDSEQRVARLRLDIEPRDGGMCDEIVVAGRPYDHSAIEIQPGTVIGWRVAGTLVAVRLLRSRGLKSGQPDSVGYCLGPVAEGGLCLDCPLADESSTPVRHNDLNAGFAVACSTTAEHSSLAEFLKIFGDWPLIEKTEPAERDIRWQAGTTAMALQWSSAGNRIIERSINGQPVTFRLLYDSPSMHLAEGDIPDVARDP